MTNIEVKLIKPKLGVLELANQLGSVGAAFKTMGYSRDSFYHFKMRYENSGKQALPEISRKKSILRKRVPEHVECSMTDLTIENPAHVAVAQPRHREADGLLGEDGKSQAGKQEDEE